MQNEPGPIELVKIIDEHYQGKDPGRALTATMLLGIRNFLRQRDEAQRLESMSIYEILELVDRE